MNYNLSGGHSVSVLSTVARRLNRVFTATATAALLALPAFSSADGFPEKNLTYQITFKPGGGSDIRARQQQPTLEEELGVKVQIEI